MVIQISVFINWNQKELVKEKDVKEGTSRKYVQKYGKKEMSVMAETGKVSEMEVKKSRTGNSFRNQNQRSFSEIAVRNLLR